MSLALHDQICFPLYAASRAIQQRYRPLLEDLGLTYTQYLVMLVLWEQDGIRVSEVGDRLLLDSGTLTPLLRRLESAGWVRRVRSQADQRVVNVVLTDAGHHLREKASGVPEALVRCIGPVDGVDPAELKRQLERLITHLEAQP